MADQHTDPRASKRMSLAWSAPCAMALDQLLLLTLAKHSMKFGYCWARQNHLAKICKVHPRSIQRSLARLEKARFITRTAQFHPNGGRASSRVELDIEVIERAISVQGDDQLIDLSEPDGADHTPDGRNLIRQAGAPPDGKAPHQEVGIYEVRRSKIKIPRNTDMSHECDEPGKREDDSEDGLFGEDIEARVQPDSASEKAKDSFKRIWNGASDHARRRSSTKELKAALVAAFRRWRDLTPDQLISAHAAYLATTDAVKAQGSFQPAIHRWIQKDRFEPFLEGQEEAVQREKAENPTIGAAPRYHNDKGEPDNPTEFGMRFWMIPYERARVWKPEQGPQPGEKGCRVHPSILREYGWTPYGEESETMTEMIVTASSAEGEEFLLHAEVAGRAYSAGAIPDAALRAAGLHHAMGGSFGIFIAVERPQGGWDILCKCNGPDHARRLFEAVVAAAVDEQGDHCDQIRRRLGRMPNGELTNGY